MRKKRIRKERDPVTVRAALLRALIGGPGYGMELANRVRKWTKDGMVIGQGSLYPALWDLEEEGLVTSWEGQPRAERGGRPRKYYQLTAEGLRQAREEQEVMMGLVLGFQGAAP